MRPTRFNPQWEFDAAIRYDEDSRQNTTDTPTHFLPDHNRLHR